MLGLGAVLVARLRNRQWAVFVASRLRSNLLKARSPLPRWLAFLFLLAACAAIICALSRPYGDAGIRTEKTIGRNVMIALDLSRSMRVADVKPDRLSQAKMVIYELLEAMPNERFGVIGFAGDAYPYAPLTVDHSAVRETVEQIDDSWVPLGGTNIAAAVKLATDTLKKTGQKNNALVILSDGEQNAGSLDDIIHEARQSGVYILAIGVGTEDGDYVPNSDFKGSRQLDRNGKPVVSRMQTDVMRKLANETKGRFAVAGTGADIPGMVKTFIKDLDAFEMDVSEKAVVIEFYQWLLLPAILFLMVSMMAGTRWRGVTAATAVFALIMTPFPARADEISAAKQALHDQEFSAAQSAYHNLAEHSRRDDTKARYRFGEATAAYHGGDFNGARSAFSMALLSRDSKLREASHLGMGNTLFQLGWHNVASSAYPRDSAEVADFGLFDRQVRELLRNMEKPSTNEDEESNTAKTLKSIITNWTDAVSQYDSALSINPGNQIAIADKRLTLAYLKRLNELLAEERKHLEQAIPQPLPQPGDGPPKDDDQGDAKDKSQPKKNPDDKANKQGSDKANNPNDAQDAKPDEKDGEHKKDEKKQDKPPGTNTNKTPEEQARDILRENADLEKGPLTPGRRIFRSPEKDW